MTVVVVGVSLKPARPEIVVVFEFCVHPISANRNKKCCNPQVIDRISPIHQKKGRKRLTVAP